MIYSDNRHIIRKYVSKEHSVYYYGQLKLGDASEDSLMEDIEATHAFTHNGGVNGIKNTLRFDIRSACCVGWDISGNIDDLANKEDDLLRFMFEFSTVLVRFMGNERYLSNRDLYDEAIVDTLVAKMILMESNYPAFIKILNNYNLLNKKTPIDITDAMKIMYIYRGVYNSVNGISDGGIIAGVQDLMDYVDIAVRSTSTIDGLTNAFDVIYKPTFLHEQHGQKYIDWLIYDFKDRLEAAKRNYKEISWFNAVQISGVHPKEKEFSKCAIESIGDFSEANLPAEVEIENVKHLDSLLEDMTEAKENLVPSDKTEELIKEIEDEPAIYAFEGIESRDAAAELRRKTRGQLLSSLKGSASSKYRKLESEAVKLKADAMNCQDVNTQSVILRKMNAFSRILGVHMNQNSKDEVFMELLVMLDDDMYTIRNILSERDFFKERASRLYGIARTDLTY